MKMEFGDYTWIHSAGGVGLEGTNLLLGNNGRRAQDLTRGPIIFTPKALQCHFYHPRGLSYQSFLGEGILQIIIFPGVTQPNSRLLSPFQHHWIV